MDTKPNELPYRLVSSGCAGKVEVVERLPGSPSTPPNPLQSHTLPRGSKSLPAVGDSPEESIMKLEASLSAILRKERRGVLPKEWIDSNSWRPSVGPTLQEIAMSSQRYTLSWRPAESFLSSGKWESVCVPLEGDAAETGNSYSVGSLETPVSKLSKYARGETGVANPFKAGGGILLDDLKDEGEAGIRDPTATVTSSWLTDEAIVFSLLPLQQSGGHGKGLLTNPPFLEEDSPSMQTYDSGNTIEGNNASVLTPQPVRDSVGGGRIGMGGGLLNWIDDDVDGLFSSDDDDNEEKTTQDSQAHDVKEKESYQKEKDNCDADRVQYSSSESLMPAANNPPKDETTTISSISPEIIHDKDLEALLDTLLISTTTTTRWVPLKAQTAAKRLLNQGSLSCNEPLSSHSLWASDTKLDLSDFSSIVPSPALVQPFELDDFQKQAIARLERDECVFVAAHTSAGKTAVAEYAIALAAKHMTRAIYTSPIKALSNQKYRDFRQKFGGDVGLITGDVSLNTDGSCLIMTTEILRSMLYRGADLIRDIEWVIFDEVHYINDSERGVVWEEVIIMLPDHIKLIFLSATTPNTMDFSGWVGRTKKKMVNVIMTYKRPVPLQHHIYAGGELFEVMDNMKNFMSGGVKAAELKLHPKPPPPKETNVAPKGNNDGRGQGRGQGGRQGAGRGQGGRQGTGRGQGGRQSVGRGQGGRQGAGHGQGGRQGAGRGQGGRQSAGHGQGGHQRAGRGQGGQRDTPGSKSQWQSLVNMLKKENKLPAVVFSFSKRKCDECANLLSSLDLTDSSEKSAIHVQCAKAVARLDEDDSRLPQVLRVCEMVRRGIGVHHGGMLPILKEVVEMLFAKGLISVLFATETFAMGVNMPARTVIFNGLRKHDGKAFRDLLPGEYTQMAGRAGRRGLDTVGTVIVVAWSEVPTANTLKSILTGSSTKLQSQFRLKYNTILTLMRVEDMSVEGMIRQSFSEFATQRAIGASGFVHILQKATSTLNRLDERAREEPCIRGEKPDIEDFHKLTCHMGHLNKKLYSMMGVNKRKVLGAGRILQIFSASQKLVDALSMVLTYEIGPKSSSDEGDTECDKQDRSSRLQLKVLVLCPVGFSPPKKRGEEQLSSNQFPESLGGLSRQSRERLEAGGDKKCALEAGKYGSAWGRTYAILEVGMDSVSVVLQTKRKIDNNALVSRGNIGAVGDAVKFLIELEEDRNANPNSPNFLPFNIEKDIKAYHWEATEMARRAEEIFHERTISICNGCPHLEDQFALENRRHRLRERINHVKHAFSNQSLCLFPDFQQRLRVLQKLQYVDPSGIVELKGRVACEVNRADELIVTEMIFENVLQQLDPAEVAALLSSLVFQEKSDNQPSVTDRLHSAMKQLKDIAMNLGNIQRAEGLDTDPQAFFVSGVNFGLVDAVYYWATGLPFKEICSMTVVPEGTIVRTVTRLDDLIMEVRNAARVIGDSVLYHKMEVASELIKRGVVFAASLYL